MTNTERRREKENPESELAVLSRPFARSHTHLPASKTDQSAMECSTINITCTQNTSKQGYWNADPSSALPTESLLPGQQLLHHPGMVLHTDFLSPFSPVPACQHSQLWTLPGPVSVPTQHRHPTEMDQHAQCVDCSGLGAGRNIQPFLCTALHFQPAHPPGPSSPSCDRLLTCALRTCTHRCQNSALRNDFPLLSSKTLCTTTYSTLLPIADVLRLSMSKKVPPLTAVTRKRH